MEQAASLGLLGALQRMTVAFQGWIPLLILVSLIAGIWIYFFTVSKHEPINAKPMEMLRKMLKFETMFWPLLGRILYISLSVFIILSGVITTFAVNFFGGIAGTVFLLILIRILFEMSMVLFTMHEKIFSLSMGPPGVEAKGASGQATGKGADMGAVDIDEAAKVYEITVNTESADK